MPSLFLWTRRTGSGTRNRGSPHIHLLTTLTEFLEPRQRLVAVGILVLMLVAAALEALGFGLILPLVALIADPDAPDTYPALGQLAVTVGATSTRELLAWVGGSIVAVFLIKNVYLSFVYYAQYRFAYSNQVKLTRKLFTSYLRQPYVVHLQRNSAELLRNVNVEAMWVFQNVLIPFFMLSIEVLVIAAIASIMIWVEPLAASLTLAALGGTAVLFYWAIRRQATVWGEAQQRHMGSMIKTVNEGLGGLKEARVLGRESTFADRYEELGAAYASANRLHRTAAELPRLLIEAIGAVGVVGVLWFMVWRGHTLQGSLPVLGLFAAGAIRLMPSLNRMIRSATTIRYFRPSVEVVAKDLKRVTNGGDARPQSDAEVPSGTIEVSGLSFSYPGQDGPTLEDISLTIEAGQSFAFVGPSGAGKSTMIDLLLGLLEPETGSINIGGVDLKSCTQQWQRQIGYVPQRVFLSDDSIRNNIAFGLHDADISDEQAWAALEAAQLRSFVEQLPSRLDTKVGERGVRISGGQQQRIGIARALYHDPEVLVLDEATSSLDRETESALASAIQKFKARKTILLIAHRLETVRHCDQLAFLKDGRLLEVATYSDLAARNPDFQAMAQLA